MADVYWNGICRLAVTHCQNPTQEFFPPKDIITSVRIPNLEQNESAESPTQNVEVPISKTKKHTTAKSTKPPKILVTLPKFYSRDIDDGHLNTRGWVLQERLLATRTIHFTENHIYYEDQDDICGEDWVRRQFTWRSCITKESKSTRSILFPEDSIRSTNLLTDPSFSRKGTELSCNGRHSVKTITDI